MWLWKLTFSVDPNSAIVITTNRSFADAERQMRRVPIADATSDVLCGIECLGPLENDGCVSWIADSEDTE